MQALTVITVTLTLTLTHNFLSDGDHRSDHRKH